ncbi:hypothetical protein [Campylobacter hyointestinalis]|uniref:hypothetical protein n=1 Tax=Campylobacter hyointestinalis TaxID=198 RepID=UPI001BD638A0|nr:hypothetical protein [Campylobacter hyointestinalis]MBT0611946.1 hypothetical protein [Campylobacter hyointestinalis subsp. hyointestinalis]MDY2999453.1 hypothetical protein [Campylobacter hyointestinalis]
MKIFAFIVVFITLIFVLPSSIIDTTIAILFGIGMLGAFIGAFGYILNTAKRAITKS